MIAVWPAWGSSNLADPALVRGAVALLREATGERIVEVPMDGAIPSGSRVVMPGGMYLSSHARFRQAIDPLLRRKRAIVLPSTFGPFTDADAATFARLRHPVAAREAASAGIAEELLGREVPVLADPALFALVGEPEAGTRTVFAPRRDDMWFGQNVPDGRASRTAAFRAYLPLVRACPDGIIVAHAFGDKGICKALSRWTGMPWVRPSHDGLLDIYRTCGSVVTSRYHGAVFGLGYGKPVTVVPFERHGHKMTIDLSQDVAALRAATVGWVREALA